MRKICFFFLAGLLLQAGQVQAQCPENTVTTDPDNYENDYDPYDSRKWDWMQPTYELYVLQNQPPVIMNSPFYDANQRPNIDHLNDMTKPDNTTFRDYLPEDGWELLFRNFGSFTQAQPTPHFLLYNRFTGIIRAFVLVANSPSSVQGATVSLEFFESGSSYFETALLNNFGDKTLTCEDYEIDALKSVPNEYVNPPMFSISDNWMFAEFTTMYDPCTCVLPSGKPTELRLRVDLLNQTDVDLESFGIIEDNLVDAGLVNTSNGFQPTLKNLYDSGSQLYKDGMQGYKDGKSWANDLEEFFEDNHDKIGQVYYNMTQEDDEVLHSIIGAAADFLPYGGLIYGVTKSVISLVKKYGKTADEEDRVQPTVKIQKIKFKTTGTLTTPMLVTDARFVLPGSPHSFAIGDSSKKTVYNNVLGTFGVLEKPMAEYVIYHPYVDSLDVSLEDFNAQNCWPMGKNMPDVAELKLRNPIEYVVNPHSGMAIKDIKFCYVIQTQYRGQVFEIGPRNGPDTYEQRIAEMGYMTELMETAGSYVNAQVSTPYLDPACFDNWTVKLFMNLGKKPTLPEISVRVRVLLEPVSPDPSSNVEELLLVYSYPLYTDTVAQDYDSENNRFYIRGVTPTALCQLHNPMLDGVYENFWKSVSITSSPFSGSFSGYQYSQTIQNQTWGTDAYAANSIYVTNNAVLQSSGGFELVAGDHIGIKPDGGGVHITGDTWLHLGIHSCFGVPDSPPSPTEVLAFCSSSKYRDRFDNSNKMRSADPLFTSLSENIHADYTKQNITEVTIRPNPNNGNFEIMTGPDFQYRMEVTDVMGRVLRTYLDLMGTNFQVDLQGYPAGMYLLKIYDTTGTVDYRKIIIQ